MNDKFEDDFERDFEHDFEQYLARQPLREIPPEWRAQILQSARSPESQPASRPEPQPMEETAPHLPWWRALIWRSPVAWACVGGAWLLIIGMNVASRPSAAEVVATPASASSPDIFAAIIRERQLVREFFQPDEGPSEPAAPPRKPDPSGAFNERRAKYQTQTA